MNNNNYFNEQERNLRTMEIVSNAIHGGNINKENKQKKNDKNDNLVEFEIEPVEFPETSIKCASVTLYSLCKLINDSIRDLINGYEGTAPKIIYEPNNNIKFTFSISVKLNPNGETYEKSDDKVDIVHNLNAPKNQKSGNDMLDRYKSVFERSRLARFGLTNEGRSILSKFCKDTKKLTIVENHLDDGNIRVNIHGLDIERVLPYIYGKKSKGLGKLEYTISLTPHVDRHILTNYNQDTAKIVTITQYNEKELRYIEEKITTNFDRNNSDYYIIR